jgi:hypothetical protein
MAMWLDDLSLHNTLSNIAQLINLEHIVPRVYICLFIVILGYEAHWLT